MRPGREFADNVDVRAWPALLLLSCAYVKGQVSSRTQACVDDPETAFVDWHMLRVQAP